MEKCPYWKYPNSDGQQPRYPLSSLVPFKKVAFPCTVWGIWPREITHLEVSLFGRLIILNWRYCYALLALYLVMNTKMQRIHFNVVFICFEKQSVGFHKI